MSHIDIWQAVVCLAGILVLIKVALAVLGEIGKNCFTITFVVCGAAVVIGLAQQHQANLEAQEAARTSQLLKDAWSHLTEEGKKNSWW
jgi:hypothetical protein